MKRTLALIATLIAIAVVIAVQPGHVSSSSQTADWNLPGPYSSIRIGSDGSIDPPAAPIQRRGDVYTLLGNIVSTADGIKIERDNMTLEGAGHTLQGAEGPQSTGIELQDRQNVTIKALRITMFCCGTKLVNSTGNLLTENDIDSNSQCGLILSHSSNNTFYHNNFNNMNQTQIEESVNRWDDGYPSGGNYWSDYSGSDALSGTLQAETRSDGIGDTSQILGINNIDYYPLIALWCGSVRNLDTGESFDHIQSAIDYSNGHARILALSNTYCECLVINKSLQLFGEGYETTTIDGSGIGTPLTINASGVSVSGFTIQGGPNKNVMLERSSNCTIQRVMVKWSMTGILLQNSSNNNLVENTIKYNSYGIQLDVSTNNIIGNNTIEWNYQCGLEAVSSRYNNVSQNVFVANFDGVVLKNSSNNDVDNNTITSNNNCGIKIVGSYNNTISRNKITTNKAEGIRLYSSSTNTISENDVKHNRGDGVALMEYSDNNYISRNDLTNSNNGVYLYAYSNHNVVNNNTLSSNVVGVKLEISSSNSITMNHIQESDSYGIFLRSCSNNTIGENNVRNSGFIGIELFSSFDCLLRNNIMDDNNFGFGVDGSEISDYTHNIDISNTVNGRPVYYITDMINVAVPSNASCVMLINCSNATIQHLNLVGNEYGIFLLNTSNILISKNNISLNRNGIYAVNSSNCIIYSNNFAHNLRQACTLGSTSIWDQGFLTGGNYWSDHLGTDLNNDGIGEQPLTIDYDNKDNYPFMGPISFLTSGTMNNETDLIILVSNSTLSDLHLSLGQEDKCISFSAEGPSRTTGFCRISIPESLLEGPYIVRINDTLASPITATNGTHTFIHFTYNHSQSLIIVAGSGVVPEFPHTIILFIFMTIALLASAMYSKALHHRHDRKTC